MVCWKVYTLLYQILYLMVVYNMKNDIYWFRKNNIDNYIDVVFSNSNYDLVNIFLHMLSMEQLIDLRNKVELVDVKKTLNFDIFYDNCSIRSTRGNIYVYIGDREQKLFVCVFLSIFKNVLSDYIEEYEKMINKDVGLLK